MQVLQPALQTIKEVEEIDKIFYEKFDEIISYIKKKSSYLNFEIFFTELIYDNITDYIPTFMCGMHYLMSTLVSRKTTYL